MAIRTTRQPQTHMISLGYLNDTRKPPTRFAGPPQCQLTEIIKPNDPRANFPKMIKTKYAEIRDLIDRGTLRAARRTELPDSANLITGDSIIAIKSDEDKEER